MYRSKFATDRCLGIPWDMKYSSTNAAEKKDLFPIIHRPTRIFVAIFSGAPTQSGNHPGSRRRQTAQKSQDFHGHLTISSKVAPIQGLVKGLLTTINSSDNRIINTIWANYDDSSLRAQALMKRTTSIISVLGIGRINDWWVSSDIIKYHQISSNIIRYHQSHDHYLYPYWTWTTLESCPTVQFLHISGPNG